MKYWIHITFLNFLLDFLSQKCVKSVKYSERNRSRKKSSDNCSLAGNLKLPLFFRERLCSEYLTDFKHFWLKKSSKKLGM